jgi:ATP-dependent helicase/nuclease subunit B
LEAGHTLVVPSAQRAASIRIAFAAHKLARGERAWRTPDVLAESEWLERELVRAADAGESVPRPLRPPEEWWVWREACRAALSDIDAPLVDSLADALRRSARLLFDWCVPVEALRGGGGESELLAHTLAGVESRCAELRAAGRHARYRLLARCVSRAGRAGVALAGFLDKTPARRALIESWQSRGLALREHLVQAIPAPAYRVEAHDEEAELELAAQWCRERLTEDPRRRLLIIVPELARRREPALRAFQHTLAAAALLGIQEAGSPFLIEGGEPLALYPLVDQALRTLELLSGHLAFAPFSAWLRSPFFADPAPAERARLDVWLRGTLAVDVAAQELLRALQLAPAGVQAGADSLAARLAAALHALAPPQEPTSLQGWSSRFESALSAIGWPGVRRLSSEEEQTRARFREVLEDAASLAPRFGAVSAVRALAVLRALCERTAFAPATGDAAITLSSALVDPVVRYDGIWVAGLHAEAWPAAPKLDPFIPAAAQRRAGITAASPAGQLAQARALLDRWRGTAGEVLMSAARHIEDREQLISPLLGGLPPWLGATAPRRDSLAHRVRATRRTERYQDRAGAPWSGRRLPAGARLIEQQSRCAFRAYAELRLASAALETPRPGIDPRARGRFIHRTLELLWRQLEDAQALAAARAAGRLAQLIEEAASAALQEMLAAGALRVDGSSARRELQRAVRLVQQLCELELARAHFRVHALEARRTLALAEVGLEVRIDRIDELDDGTYAIFDYKSGRPAQLGWSDARIAQPQLPVYLLASGLNVSTLAAVHVTPQQGGYRGLADRAGRLPRVDTVDDAGPSAAASRPESAWLRQIQIWRGHIEQLAREFMAGHAAADPLAQACQTCHLQAFCRIGDQGAAAKAGSEAVAGSADE